MGHGYPCDDNLVAWRAIRENHSVIVDDISAINHFGKLKVRPYRSIIGFPVAKDSKSYAALCIDSKNPYEFTGRGVDLNVNAQPYIALLIHTFSALDPSEPLASTDDQYRWYA